MAKSLQELLAYCLPQGTDNWRITLLDKWPTIFGPLSNRVMIESMYEDTIVLGVTDACLMQELYLLSPLILQTIQKSLGNSTIKQVRFKRAAIIKFQKNMQSVPIVAPRKKVKLTSAELHALDCIEDNQLKEALRLYCIRCHQEREL